MGAGGPRAYYGRARELSELRRGLDDAASGRAQLFLLVGEPGIGKTRLAEELAATALERGFAAASGRAFESSGTPAYWPWRQLLAGLGERCRAAGLALAAPRAAHSALDPEAARFELFRELADALVADAARAPRFLLLDDLHAADRSSLHLLHFVARHVCDARLFVLGTFRDVEARHDPEIGAALARLGREGRTLALGRLPADEVGAFVRGARADASTAFVDSIFRATQGNPLFVEEVLRLFPAGAPERDAAALPMPMGVAETIGERLRRLSTAARAHLDAAAVLGGEVSTSTLAAVTGADGDALRASLDEAVRAGVLVPSGDGRNAFSHPLVRDGLVRELSPERRRALHGRAADALAGAGLGGAVELAHHLLEAGPERIGDAVHAAARASSEALSLAAYEDAIDLLERVRVASEASGAEPRLRVELSLARGKARIGSGQSKTGRELCLEAASQARALGDATLLGRAALAYGDEITPGFVSATLAGLLHEALGALGDGDSPLRARLRARLAAALQPATDPDGPMALAREAIEESRRLGDEGVHLEVLHSALGALMDYAPPEERMRLCTEAADLAQERGDEARLLRARLRLVFDALELGDVEGVDARIAAYAERAAALHHPRHEWPTHMLRSMRAAMDGRFADGEAHFARARASIDAAQDRVGALWATMHRFGLLRARERHDALRALEPEARALIRHMPEGPSYEALCSASVAARVDDAERARVELGRVAPRGPFLTHDLVGLSMRAEAAAICGDRAHASSIYARLAGQGRRFVSWGMTGMICEGPVERLLGLCAGALERWDAAERHFAEAVAICERSGLRPMAARTRYEHARALLGSGDAAQRPRARSLLEAALEGAKAMDLEGLAGLARRRFDEIAAPAPSRLETGPEARNLARDAGARSSDREAAPLAVAEALPFELRREGDFWTLRSDEGVLRLRHSRGLEILARLVERPGEEIHVLDLGARHGGAVDGGDAGEHLDQRARDAYRARLRALRAELDEAEDDGDLGRAERLREELEALTAELSRALGLGGRGRRAGAAVERARVAVRQRVREALAKIAEGAPALGRHLEWAVRTGTFCVYRGRR